MALTSNQLPAGKVTSLEIHIHWCYDVLEIGPPTPATIQMNK
jgi:hypothetical protein